MSSPAVTDNKADKPAARQGLPRAVLSWREVTQLTGLARNTLRAEMARGRFPPQRQLTPGRLGFIATEVDQWLANLPKVPAAAKTDQATGGKSE